MSIELENACPLLKTVGQNVVHDNPMGSSALAMSPGILQMSSKVVLRVLQPLEE